MRKIRSIVGGAGTLLASALVTLISMMGSQWVKDHPITCLWLGLALLLGSIGSLIFWISTRDSNKQAVVREGGNSAGRDNSGTQIAGSVYGDSAIEKLLRPPSAVGRSKSRLHVQSAEYVSVDDPARSVLVTDCLRQMVVDDHLALEVQNHNFTAGGKNYVPQDPHPGHLKKLVVVYSFNDGPLDVATEVEGAKLRLPPTPARTIISRKNPCPNLSVEFSGGSVEVSFAVVSFRDGGEKCHSIRVHNRRAEVGQDASRADSLSAGLTFTFAGSSRVTYVDRACWIDKVENEVTLQPGDTRHVLLGIPRKDAWVTYENPNRYASGGWPSHDQDLVEVVVPLFTSAKIIGEISIISHKPDSATTLLTRRFVMTVDYIGLNLAWESSPLTQ